jgi:hypothetical protein
MQLCSVILVEAGFPAAMPGLPADALSATFPFWGSYQILDFAAANYRDLAASWTVLVEGRLRGQAARIPAGVFAGADTVAPLPAGVADGLRDLLARLRSCSTPKVLLAPLSQVCLLDSSALAEAAQAQQGIAKLTLDDSPTDIFLADRRALVRCLKASLEQETSGEDLAGALFDRILEGAFETIVDIPGTVFFRNSLMQLHSGNLWLALNLGGAAACQALSCLRPVGPGPEIIIERGGEVRHSFLGPGCRVEGYVEGSVLFPEVVVHKGAVVYNSVVMTGNRIGARAQLCRVLLLPDGGPATSVNIGENASIGLKASGAVNLMFPQQIREGLTVLGMGVQIPRGFTIGPGCLVGSGVSLQTLKGMREIRKGNSVLCTTDR